MKRLHLRQLPLSLNRARGIKPGWTDKPQQMSIYSWADLDKLETRIHRTEAFFRMIYRGCIGFVVVAIAISGTIQLARIFGWLA